MSKVDDAGEGAVSSKDARIRFAELLRRAEHNKERIRLTRRGKPIAYVVPLEDVERLHRLDEMERSYSESAEEPPAETPYEDDMIDGPEEDDFDQSYEASTQSPPSLTHHELTLQHGDENKRETAIAAFRKSLHRIFKDSEKLDRAEMARCLKKDGYLGSTLKRIIGEETT